MKVKLMRTASRNSGGNGTFPETKMGLFRVYTEILEKKMGLFSKNWDFSDFMPPINVKSMDEKLRKACRNSEMSMA